MGCPAHQRRVQGRRPVGGRRAPGPHRLARRQRAVPDAGLPVRVEPSLPHVRLPGGRSASRRGCGPAGAPRSGARPGHAGDPRRRLQPHRPGLLAVSPRARDRRRLALPQLVPLRPGRPRPPQADRRIPDGPAPCRDADGRALARHRRDRRGLAAWWGIPALPKLNTDERAVREYLFGVAEHWLRFGIDGWRLDVPAEINDRSFWQEFRQRCRAANPEAYLVGEIWHVAPEWLSGDRFDGLMNYPLAEAIIGFVAGATLNEPLLRSHHEYARITRLDGPAFAAALGELLSVYAPETNAAQLNLLGSHDTPRVVSLLGGDIEAMELAMLLQGTLPGAPCVYYGDEIGLTGGKDPESRKAFPWEPARWESDLLDATRRIFALRRAEPALRSDDVAFLHARDRALAFERRHGSTRLGVAINAGEAAASLPLGVAPGQAAIVLATGRGRIHPPGLDASDGGFVVRLPPRSGAVVRLGRGGAIVY